MRDRESFATSTEVRERMRRQKRRDTAVELRLRSLLHGAGLRYRVHRRPLPALRRAADIVFGPARVAVFVDGCFWHGCGCRSTVRSTAANAQFWNDKIRRNRERDAETGCVLESQGWMVVRVWEHEDLSVAATDIARLVAARRVRSLRESQRDPREGT